MPWRGDEPRKGSFVIPFNVEDVHAAADKAGVKWDNNKAFMDLSERVTGKRHLDDMTERELRRVASSLRKNPISRPRTIPAEFSELF
jgi:hypothetical protein